jgi:RimJ/RimL family protein N-acetyltransferase
MENYGIMLKNSTSIGEEGNGNTGEKMIGILGIPRLSPSELAAEVGYALLPEYWGMGYASEALTLFRTYYFNSTRKLLLFFLLSPPPLSFFTLFFLRS